MGVVRDAQGAAVDVAGAARQLTYSGPEEGGGVEVHTEDETGAEVATDDAEAVQPPVPPQNRKQRRSNKKRR